MQGVESTIERNSVDYALGFSVPSIKMDQLIKNYPDRCFFCPNLPLIVEFKKKGEKARKGQARKINMFKRLGYATYVIDDFEVFKKIFDSHMTRGML